MSSEHRDPFQAQFCIVELLGHRRLAGYVSEVEIAGHGMLRIDVAGADGDHEELGGGGFTTFVSPQSVYALTPCSRDVALTIARQQTPQPVQAWDVRALLPEIRESVRAEIENEVRAEAWREQRQMTNVYTAGEPDEYDAEELPL